MHGQPLATQKEPARRRGNRSSRKPATRQENKGHAVLYPDLNEVLAAMRSLYDEQLRPFGRILRKRIGERASTLQSSAPDVDARHLRNVCDTSPLISVEQEEGGDWSALLDGEKCEFIDVYSPEDTYPEDVWNKAGAYFQQMSSDDFLPGGRYACAQELASRQLPFFADRTLGQICHIVQLAISQKRLLGYLNGSLVPYCRSQTLMKEHAAQFQQPCGGAGVASGALPLSSLEDARRCLGELLDSVAVPAPGDSPATMPLSNVKRLFRSRYNLELSETALGHSKLCELLASPEFADLCTVRLDWNGYTVVQVQPGEDEAMKSPMHGPRVEGAPASAQSEPRRVLFCVDEPLTFESDVFAEADGVPLTKATAARLPTPGGVLKVYNGQVEANVQNTFITTPPAPTTPVPGARPRAQTAPNDFGSSKEEFDTELQEEEADEEPVKAPETASNEASTPTRLVFCADEPLGLEEEETKEEKEVPVVNTFLHVAAAPPTPLPGARRRANSLPKESSRPLIEPEPSPSPVPPTPEVLETPCPWSSLGSPAYLKTKKPLLLGGLTESDLKGDTQ